MMTLRKLNTKIAIRLMMILIVLLSIVGSFHLFELFQNELIPNSNFTTSIFIKNLILLYFVPMFSIAICFYFLYEFSKNTHIFTVKTFRKSFFFAFFLVMFIPGFLYFPEAYGISSVMFILPMIAFYIVVILARFLQNYTDEQIGIMKSDFKNLIRRV